MSIPSSTGRALSTLVAFAFLMTSGGAFPASVSAGEPVPSTAPPYTLTGVRTEAAYEPYLYRTGEDARACPTCDPIPANEWLELRVDPQSVSQFLSVYIEYDDGVEFYSHSPPSVDAIQPILLPPARPGQSRVTIFVWIDNVGHVSNHLVGQPLSVDPREHRITASDDWSKFRLRNAESDQVFLLARSEAAGTTAAPRASLLLIHRAEVSWVNGGYELAPGQRTQVHAKAAGESAALFSPVPLGGPSFGGGGDVTVQGRYETGGFSVTGVVAATQGLERQVYVLLFSRAGSLEIETLDQGNLEVLEGVPEASPSGRVAHGRTAFSTTGLSTQASLSEPSTFWVGFRAGDRAASVALTNDAVEKAAFSLPPQTWRTLVRTGCEGSWSASLGTGVDRDTHVLFVLARGLDAADLPLPNGMKC